MKNRHWRLTAALAVTLAVIFTGCAKDKDDKPLQPTDDQSTAISRVEKLIQEASTALPDGATLRYSDGGDDSPCSDPEDNGAEGRIFVEKRYTVVPPSTGNWQDEQVIPDLVTYWQQQQYRVHDDRRAAPDIPTYIVETTDGYRISVAGYSRNDHHDYTLSASSPCIWQTGSAAPK